MPISRESVAARRRLRGRSLSVVAFVERININKDQRHIRSKRQARGDGGSTQPPAVQLTSKQRLASRVYNLSLDVAALRQELEELSLHCSLLRTRASFSRCSSEDSAVATTQEYWRVISRGFQPTDSRQSKFLQSVTEDKLPRRGLDELLQWQLYTEYFAISSHKLHLVRVVATDATTGSCVTRSDGVFHGSITRRALEIVFPTVLRSAQLTQQLLGKTIVTPISFTLHYDCEGKWICHETETDFVQALAGVLGGDVIQAAKILVETNVSATSLLRSPQMASRDVHQRTRVERTRRPWYLAHIPSVNWRGQSEAEPMAVENGDVSLQGEVDTRLSLQFLLV